ncbi:GroES-like protein [Hortaea werneckii]|nr:GroES-like protein [Hortaea werneckii]
MPSIMERAADLVPRYVCNGYYDNCYNGAWNSWARWLVLALIIVGAFFIFFLFSCITARRRRRHGYRPYRGTGWALGRTPAGHAPAQYNSAAPYYANYQPQYNNSNNPPPPPSYGQSQSYYGQNADYYGRQNDVELQQPENAYKPPEDKMKAIKVVENGKAELQEVPVPKLKDDYVLVKVKAVALNPTDWKHIDKLAIPGHTVGCDFAGVVEEIGPKVKKDWKKGDRIAGFTHGVNSADANDGCFAEYCQAKGDLWTKIPDNVSDEDASTLGVGVSTVGQGLYQSLGLPLPGSGKAGVPILIYGGSTATGSLAIQYALLSGCDVIATCSERNFPFVKSLGASAAFDYKDPDCAKKIREHTKDQLAHVFDCISEGESPKICSEAIGSQGGTVSYLLPAKHDRADVQNRHTLAYTMIGEGFKFGPMDFPDKPEDKEFGEKFWDISGKLITSKQISVHPPKVGKGGLEGVFDGLQQLREGKVSGVKLVYRVA